MTAIASQKRHHHHHQFASSISHHPPHHHTVTQQLVQPARNHYVNICPDLLPPPPPPHSSSFLLAPRNTSSRETSVSDSEMSTSSISGLSESSEIRALFASLPSSHGVYDSNLATTNSSVSMTENNPHYNQLKIVEGSKASERTRRILHRPSYMESDSSSSLAESSESLVEVGGGGGGRENGTASKQKEKEHYDKLKLNLDNLSGNRRAISGGYQINGFAFTTVQTSITATYFGSLHLAALNMLPSTATHSCCLMFCVRGWNHSAQFTRAWPFDCFT